MDLVRQVLHIQSIPEHIMVALGFKSCIIRQQHVALSLFSAQ